MDWRFFVTALSGLLICSGKGFGDDHRHSDGFINPSLWKMPPKSSKTISLRVGIATLKPFEFIYFSVN